MINVLFRLGFWEECESELHIVTQEREYDFLSGCVTISIMIKIILYLIMFTNNIICIPNSPIYFLSF